MQVFKKFIIKELVFTSSIGLIALILFRSVLSDYYLPIFWILLLIIALLTGIMHYSILQVEEKSAAKFSTKFMTLSGVKMMIYLIMITVYAFMYPLKAKFFLLSFIILYLLYTIFEVFLMVKHLNKK